MILWTNNNTVMMSFNFILELSDSTFFTITIVLDTIFTIDDSNTIVCTFFLNAWKLIMKYTQCINIVISKIGSAWWCY